MTEPTATIDDPVIRNDWYVVARSSDLEEGAVMEASLLGETLVLWRTGGEVLAWKDLCIHRGSKLSLGWSRTVRSSAPITAGITTGPAPAP